MTIAVIAIAAALSASFAPPAHAQCAALPPHIMINPYDEFGLYPTTPLALGDMLTHRVKVFLPQNACDIVNITTTVTMPDGSILTWHEDQLTVGQTLVYSPPAYFIDFADLILPQGMVRLHAKVVATPVVSASPVTHQMINNSIIRDTDLNGDGRVDAEDLTTILEKFGNQGMAWYDTDFNDRVNIDDLLAILTDWGEGRGK